MKKILSSTKLGIFLRFGRNVYQASIDRQNKDEGREGSSGSWRSWSSTGTVLMVGSLVLSSENKNDQGESGAERSELRDGQGQLSSKAKLEKKKEKWTPADSRDKGMEGKEETRIRRKRPSRKVNSSGNPC